MPPEALSVAVLIPCHNEAFTVAEVIGDFKEQLPHAKLYVYDNCSTDNTADIARGAGAIVGLEPLKGKGNVIRRMFADIESDIYVMVDGDATYPAQPAPALIGALLEQKLDMVIGARRAATGAYRRGHNLGNRLFARIVGLLFGYGDHDIFSGYRVFSRRFVKSFPAMSRGFEIETELSVHALDLHLPFAEIPVEYKPRPAGSASKLHTYRDGFHILIRIIMLFKEAKPFWLFSFIALGLLLLALVLGYPLVVTFLATGLVPRIPTAIIVIGLAVFAFTSFASGIILDGIAQLKRENKRLHYLKLEGLR